jgi:hypothetical protein
MNQNAMLAIVTALASLAIALTIQQQDVAAFNDNNQFVRNHHDHTHCGTEIGSCTGNDGTVTNDESTHTNDNFNSHREPAHPAQKTHTVDKPDNDK